MSSWAALERPDMGAVDHCSRHVQPTGGPQLGKQHLVQPLPDPALFQSRGLRQQVIPEPDPSSAGSHSQRIPVWRTNRIPHRTLRLSGCLRPGCRG
ncbi:hypothetical protein AVL59_25110 [Streptomyces griseochromogenes]|uniref:Uncharacterized protein n=1 Tax=Streptomyces griseochromogenes TaxID=68214 RepID=A0A1B1B0P3_9ACTN|nr:hypothetical protein AVL59_25110 [Streptomyces griseochromogenes]